MGYPRLIIVAIIALGLLAPACKDGKKLSAEQLDEPIMKNSLCSTCHPLQALRLERLLVHPNEVSCQQCHGNSTWHRLKEGEVIPSRPFGRDDEVIELLKARLPAGVDPLRFHWITFSIASPTPNSASAPAQSSIPEWPASP